MLPQIERLTWFQALACFTTQPFSQTGCRLFVNSIASQALSEPDIREIERLYGPYLEPAGHGTDGGRTAGQRCHAA